MMDFHECLSFPKHMVSGVQPLPLGLSWLRALEDVLRGLTLGMGWSLGQGGTVLVLWYIAEGVIEVGGGGEPSYLLSPV